MAADLRLNHLKGKRNDIPLWHISWIMTQYIARPRWRTYELLHQDIAYQARMSHHDVSRIHIVGHPPEDLQMASVRPVIVQQPQDATEGSTFQLILLDVEFHNAMPSLDAETVRRAKLLPKTISRKALLAVSWASTFLHLCKTGMSHVAQPKASEDAGQSTY